MGLVYPLLEFSIREDLRHRLRNPADRYVCLVAVQHPERSSEGAGADAAAPKIVGTMEMSVRKRVNWWSGDRHIYISNLAVDRHCRRHGVARRLLLVGERISLDWGISTLNLHVMADNAAARRLYHKAGYSPPPRKGGVLGIFQPSRRLLLCKDVV